MSIDAKLEERAMHLPSSDRAELARKLILSLEGADWDAKVDQAWESEIELRLAALDRGEVTPIDWRPVIERARASLAKNQRP